MRLPRLIALIPFVLFAQVARAEDDVNARIAALEAHVAELQQQLAQLRAVPAQPPEPEPSDPAAAGPTVTIGGMLETQFIAAAGGSLKQAIFSDPKGNADIVLTHVHPVIRASLDDKNSALINWCLTHAGSTAVYEAYVEHNPNDRLGIKAGRFLLPFGAWNAISNPSMFKTVSRPLMYLGHDDEGIVLQGGPRPILNDEHSDLGLLLSGRAEGRNTTLTWDAYATNGLGDQFGNFPGAWIDFRSSEDNNTSKSIGSRLAATRHGLTLGASWTGGKWDPQNKLRYSIAAADVTWRAPSGLTLRAEFTTNRVNRSEGEGGRIRREGWFAMAEQPVAPKWTAVAMYSALTERPTENVKRVARLTLGANYKLADSTTIKTEIGRLFIGGFIGDTENAPQGTHFDDVTTLKVSSVVSF